MKEHIQLPTHLQLIKDNLLDGDRKIIAKSCKTSTNTVRLSLDNKLDSKTSRKVIAYASIIASKNLCAKQEQEQNIINKLSTSTEA